MRLFPLTHFIYRFEVLGEAIIEEFVHINPTG